MERKHAFNATPLYSNIPSSAKEPAGGLRLALALEIFNSLADLHLADAEIREAYLPDNYSEKISLLLGVYRNAPLESTESPSTASLPIFIASTYNSASPGYESLQVLNFNRNLARLRDIRLLCLTNNRLRYFPCAASQLRCLESLYIDDNLLTYLPADIGRCSSLMRFSASNNLLRSVPASISALKNLVYLNVSGNLLTSIPPALGKCDSLQRLSISRNKISMIPFEILKLPYLRYIETDEFPSADTGFRIQGELTLFEEALRLIYRNYAKVHSCNPWKTEKAMLQPGECCFCSGPFFDYYVEIVDYVAFDSRLYPVHYKLCTMHYKKHNERLEVLFDGEKALGKTHPTRMINRGIPSITYLCCPLGYSAEHQKQCSSGSRKEELIPLMQFFMRSPTHSDDDYTLENTN